jgi:predicted DNA-binding protein (MmcQ/YjbR family)
MPHPRMYADDDPHLDDVRRVCLALPEAVEVEAWGRPTFRAGAKGKMFAIFEGDAARPYGLVFKPAPDERDALLADSRFWSPAYHGASGWLAHDLSTADWAEVAELVETSYRQVALKRQLKALEA